MKNPITFIAPRTDTFDGVHYHLATLGGTVVENGTQNPRRERGGLGLFALGLVVLIVVALRGRKDEVASARPNSFRSHPAEG